MVRDAERKMSDTMDTWDEEKLRDVVMSKHGNPRTTTDVRPSQLNTVLVLTTSPKIVCKYFIQAIETEKCAIVPYFYNYNLRHVCDRFGWFWECPNGESCQYRHALPPGFMLKSQRKAAEDAEKANTISLEEFLEVEVRPRLHYLLSPAHLRPPATQTRVQPYSCHA